MTARHSFEQLLIATPHPTVHGDGQSMREWLDKMDVLTVISEGTQQCCIEESCDGISSNDYPAIAQSILQLGSSGALGTALHSCRTPLPIIRMTRPTSCNALGAAFTAAEQYPAFSQHRSWYVPPKTSAECNEKGHRQPWPC